MYIVVNSSSLKLLKEQPGGNLELYKKYRPKNLGAIVGNDVAVKTIKRYKELPHAILLTGPTGCGKTTLARILKRKVNCKGFDFVEMDTGVFNGIDTVRDISKKIMYKPTVKGSKARVYLIDEAHMLGIGGSSEKNKAQNALLKILEECPIHIYFILCTTNPEMLLPTIKGRCVEFKMKTLSDTEMGILINKVCKKEKVKIPEDVLDQIIDDSEGHPRNALNILDKVIVLDDEDEMLDIAKEEGKNKNSIKDLGYALMYGKTWSEIQPLLKGVKSEAPETIRRSILGLMSSALLDGWGLKKGNPWYVMAWFYDKATYDSGFTGIVFCCKSIADGVEPPY